MLNLREYDVFMCSLCCSIIIQVRRLCPSQDVTMLPAGGTAVSRPRRQKKADTQQCPDTGLELAIKQIVQSNPY